MPPPTVLRMAMGHGLRLAAGGIGIGLALAGLAAQSLSSLLYGTGALDPFNFGTVTLVVFCLAVLATWIPAHRADAA